MIICLSGPMGVFKMEAKLFLGFFVFFKVEGKHILVG